MCPRPVTDDYPGFNTLPEFFRLAPVGWWNVRTHTQPGGSAVGATSIFDCYLQTGTDKTDKLYYTYKKGEGRYNGFNQRGDDGQPWQAAPNDAATENGAVPPDFAFSAGKGSSLGARASVSLACAAMLVVAAAAVAAAA